MINCKIKMLVTHIDNRWGYYFTIFLYSINLNINKKNTEIKFRLIWSFNCNGFKIQSYNLNQLSELTQILIYLNITRIVINWLVKLTKTNVAINDNNCDKTQFRNANEIFCQYGKILNNFDTQNNVS